jgi:hypothetical protein
MTQELSTLEKVKEEAEIKQRMAERANERLNSFQLMPTLTVANSGSDPSQESKFNPGDFILSTKSEAGYENEVYDKPFQGIIIKVRMFLKTKYSAIEKGSPLYITDEFDSYSALENISVKEKKEDKFEKVFQGDYHSVIREYTEKGKFTEEKILDLHHAIYVLTDIENKTVIRIDSKGKSRGRFFDFMNSFKRSAGEYMSSTMSSFDSIQETLDWKGKPLQRPVYAIDFSKVRPLTSDELRKVDTIQQEFDAQIKAKDIMFKEEKDESKQIEAPVENQDKAEEIPVIQIEEEIKQPTLPEEEREVRIEDVPF